MAFDGPYRPRNPEENPLYKVVSGHLETFLARQRERDRNVPSFVESAFRSFLDCGEESDPLSRDQPWLAGLYAASVLGRTAFGPNAGRRAQLAAELAAERGALERAERERAERAAQVARLQAAIGRDEELRPSLTAYRAMVRIGLRPLVHGLVMPPAVLPQIRRLDFAG